MILSLQLGLPIPMFLQRSFKTYLQNLNVIWVSHISNILKSTWRCSSQKGSSKQITQFKRQVVNNEVDILLKSGVIGLSTSPLRSSVILCTKEDGSSRFCLDYRHLNLVTHHAFNL